MKLTFYTREQNMIGDVVWENNAGSGEVRCVEMVKHRMERDKVDFPTAMKSMHEWTNGYVHSILEK